jgi:GxxExxY protein
MLEERLSAAVLQSFFDVYHEHGHGFLEPVYVNSMVVELEHRGLSVQQELAMDVRYRGRIVGRYRADLVVENRILVEVKAIKKLADADQRQLINYLKASPIEVGLLLNFGPEPKFLRRILTNDRKRAGIPWEEGQGTTHHELHGEHEQHGKHDGG